MELLLEVLTVKKNKKQYRCRFYGRVPRKYRVLQISILVHFSCKFVDLKVLNPNQNDRSLTIRKKDLCNNAVKYRKYTQALVLV